MKKRTAALLLTFVLIFGAAVGGTVAWLTAKTDDVVNTFTVGDINIDLREHKLMTNEVTGKYYLDENSEVQTNSYNFVPGDTLPKDPFVRVRAGSEACYLFIKVTEEHNTITVSDKTEKVINYKVDDKVWTPVDGHAGYWYKEVEATGANASDPLYILTGNDTFENGCVEVNTGVTKSMVDDLNASNPKVIFTAAAIQSENIANVATAFAQLPDDFTA